MADEHENTQLDDTAARLGEPLARLTVAVVHASIRYSKVLCGAR
jgi:hypothetical protein